MTNLPNPGVFDATGAGDALTLPAGTMYPRTVAGVTRLVAHDGVTKGGFQHATKPEVDSKVASLPQNPASTATSAANDLMAGFNQRYFDTANNRLIPCRGLGGANSGIPDPTLPDGSGNKLSPWIWAMQIGALAERARQTQTTTAIARVAGAWAYFKTQFTTVQITSPVYGTNQMYGLADDAAWIVNAFLDIGDVTGDATAYQTAIEAHAAAYNLFQDTRAGNAITSYGVTTPGGLAVQRNVMGIQYDVTHGVGDIATTHEIGLGIAARRISKLPDATIAAFYSSNGTASAQSLKAAMLALAKDTWTWAYTYPRWPGTLTTAVAGLQASAINLGPTDANRFKIQYGMANEKPTTKRGYTCFADHGTIGMAVLSDMLWEDTGDGKYSTEFALVLAAYATQTTGFGRSFNGMPCFVNAQDPFTDGRWHAEAVRRAVLRSVQATDYLAFKQGVLGTGLVITSLSGNGSISPNWSPPELSNGFGCFTWEQDSANAGDGRGGNQADGRQAMTASSSMMVVLARALLAAQEPALGSGMNAAQVSLMIGQIASTLASSQGDRFNPFRHLGPHFSVRGSLNSATGHLLIDDVDQLQLGTSGIDIWNSASTHGNHLFFGNVYAVNQGIAAFTNETLQFYLGKPGGNYGLNFASGSYVNGNAGAIYLGIGNAPIISVTTGGVTVNTLLATTQDIRPVYDNQLSLGAPGQRWAGIYLANSPNVTSDAGTKTEVTPFTDAEIAFARQAIKLFRKWKSIDAVAKKGASARWHSGALAQEIVRAAQDHDLIPQPGAGLATDILYDWVGHDTWAAEPAVEAITGVEEVSHLETITTDSGKEIQVRVVDVPSVMAVEGREAREAGALYSVRYEPLYAWCLFALDAALTINEAATANLASRITALEAINAK